MKAIVWICLTLSAVVLVGCADGNACDPEMERDGNYCVVPSSNSPEGMGGMGGESSGPPVAQEPSEIFGSTCTAEDESETCGGDAPNCGLQPGADEGICTVFGCKSDPETVVCPIGWSCFDLADACLED